MLGSFGVFSFLRSSKLTHFLATCITATSFKIWTFSALLYISETTRTNFFKISSHSIHNVCNNVWNFHYDWFTATPWNFKTNLSYEPVKNLRYNIHCFDVMLIFPKYCVLYIPPWLVHFSLNLSHLLNVKHWQYIDPGCHRLFMSGFRFQSSFP